MEVEIEADREFWLARKDDQQRLAAVFLSSSLNRWLGRKIYLVSNGDGLKLKS